MLSGAANIVSLIREIDLSKTRAEADARFAVLLVGAREVAGALAGALSEGASQVGAHPWLVVEDLTFSAERGDYDLAIFVTSALEPSEEERRALRRLQSARVPVLAAVVSDRYLGHAGADIPRPLESARVVLPSSLEPGALRSVLAPALLALNDRLALSLARQLPVLRSGAVQALIESTSRANALYTASSGLAKVVPILNIPLNVADIVVLTKNQLVMAYKIALMAGKSGDPKDILGEIVGVMGGGFFFRQVARELVGLVPVIGIVPNVAVSYAGTKVIGHSVYTWACGGENLGRTESRQRYNEALEQGRKLARALLSARRRRAALPPSKDELGSGGGRDEPPADDLAD